MGKALIEFNEKEKKGKLIILDTVNCNVFGIKEFNFTDILKFAIIDIQDESKLNEANNLFSEADMVRIQSDIASLKNRSFYGSLSNSFSQAVVDKKISDAYKALESMKKLYILFNDGSQFLISDLNNDAYKIHDYFLNEK